MTRSQGETIQVSLGSSANAVTAHLLNLQGLGCTPGGGGDDNESNVAFCEPSTTHSLEDNHWVPRVLLVDEPTRFFASSQVSQQQQLLSQAHQSPSPFVVEPVDTSLSLRHDEPQAWDTFFNSSSVLAHSSHSRYYQATESRVNYNASASNPRHVVWDEAEEEAEEDEYERSDRLHREQRQWRQQTEAPLQEQLGALAESNPQPTSWMEYLMPPYSSRSKVALPYSSQSHMVAHWDRYNASSDEQAWKEDVLFEKVRHLLEDCDTCQGVTITTQGHGMYAGLATALLQEFQQECKSAGRLTFYITNPEPSQDATNEDHDPDAWQPAHVERVRAGISTGLAWNDFTQNSHAVLPLRLPETGGASLFESSAKLALALEASTLPFRLGSKDQRRPDGSLRSQIGLQNAPFYGHGGGDDRWGSTAQKLTFGEFLAMLQPSPRYSVLELDVAEAGSFTNSDLYDQWKAGTSVERDLRMRHGGSDSQRGRQAPPGNWLQDTSKGGILTSRSLPLASSDVTKMDRSLQYHYSLSTAIRPVLHGDMSQYLTSLVQGMGIQYRPERSMCTVVDQTVGRLTHGGYGAGAYWSLFVKHDTPVVAVIGNTSRPYKYLHQMATGFKTVLGSRYRGYYQRDVLNGVFPELEDCHEALANNWDLVELYNPPDGSGLGLGGDGDIDL